MLHLRQRDRGDGQQPLSRENGRTVLPVLQLYRGTTRKNKTVKTRKTMSKINRMVELVPPRIKSASERLVSRGHACGYCHGNGYFWGSDTCGENEKVPCPICLGRKTVDAVVTIEWKASDNV